MYLSINHHVVVVQISEETPLRRSEFLQRLTGLCVRPRGRKPEGSEQYSKMDDSDHCTAKGDL